MASHAAKIISIEIARGNDDVLAGTDTANTDVMRVLITLDHNAAFLGNGEYLTVDVSTVLPASFRDKRTYALCRAGLETPALTVAANGDFAAYTADIVVSSNTIQVYPISAADGSSAVGFAAAEIFKRPYRVLALVHAT